MPPTVSEVRVRYAETDQMGVAYHANYLVWCEIGRIDFIRAHGMSYVEMERNGISLAVSGATIRFHAAAKYDDVVKIETALVEVRSRSLTFEYLLTRGSDGERLASARTALITISPDHRPVVVPADLRARLGAVRTEPGALTLRAAP